MCLVLCAHEGAENYRCSICRDTLGGGKKNILLPAAEPIFEAHPDGRSCFLEAIYSLVIHQRSHLPFQQNQHLL